MGEPSVTNDAEIGGVSDLDLDTATIPELQRRMSAGEFGSAELTEAYRERIRRLDPDVRSVLALDPTAPAQAKASDRRRVAGRLIGPLDGIPVLVKDNIEAVGLPGSAGSRALLSSQAGRDAPVLRLLRAAGAVLLGATNLSEWANFRSNRSTSGWSAVGGQTANPHVLDRNPSGSSSGSAVAVAAAFAQVTIGTETDGSIVSPAAVCGVVGHKPSVGLISRSGIVPITPHQDTAGPMGRHVIDVALTMAVLCGADPDDPVTATAPTLDWTLTPAALAGARIGLWRQSGVHAGVDRVVEASVAALAEAGAVLVEVDLPDLEELGRAEWAAMVGEFKPAVERYLRSRAGAPRTLAELVEFNASDPVELSVFGQEIFELSLAADPTDKQHRTTAGELARRYLDEAFDTHELDALFSPTTGPAPRLHTDEATGDPGDLSSSTLPAVSGYPHVTVPAGFVGPLPLGVSFIGPRWSDARLLALAAGFEAATTARRAPTFRATLD
ncbi:MAG TPA: amidase family protein [Pseudonocardiaceae bacterium]|nr:amidase family protein [Pseudonocardiaceae bacterium]